MIKAINPINFGYSSILKTLCKQGKISPPDFYGGELSKDTVSVEHIKLHSKGGQTKLSNIVLTSAKNNNLRGNKPLIDFFNPEAAKEYFNYFAGLLVPYKQKGKIKVFDGDCYIKNVQKTISEVLKEDGIKF